MFARLGWRARTLAVVCLLLVVGAGAYVLWPNGRSGDGPSLQYAQDFSSFAQAGPSFPASSTSGGRAWLVAIPPPSAASDDGMVTAPRASGFVSPHWYDVVLSEAEGARFECPTAEEVYASIALVTDGRDIGEIMQALEVLSGGPAAASADSANSALVRQLREALRLDEGQSCETTGLAIAESLRLARLAAAGGEGATGAIPGDPTPSFSAFDTGNVLGAGNAGYTSNSP